jgi:hypothetical protein
MQETQNNPNNLEERIKLEKSYFLILNITTKLGKPRNCSTDIRINVPVNE